MSDLLKALVLGIIEGFTEFLPISSTGHMILAMPLLGVQPDAPPWKSFLYFIQIGAILAVVVYFWRSLWPQLVRRPAGGLRRHLLVKLAVATLPAAAIGLPASDWVERHLESPVPVAVALLLGAAVMELIERRYRRERASSPKGATVGCQGREPLEPVGAKEPEPSGCKASAMDAVTLRQAALIGLAQCVSIIPGTSRSMATIMGGLLVGVPIAAATEFSFYLAIPTLLGAGLLKVVKHAGELDAGHAALLTAGFAAAFASAIVVVDAFMRYVQTRRLRPFAVYRVILGAVVLAWWWRAG